MSHSLLHSTLTTSTSFLSPISSTSLTFTNKPYGPRPKKKPCDVPRENGGSTQIPFPTRDRGRGREQEHMHICSCLFFSRTEIGWINNISKNFMWSFFVLAGSVLELIDTYIFNTLRVQEAVQMVAQRAREAPNDQRGTVRRALLQQHGEFLAATHQYEAAARQNLVSALARNEAHNYNVQRHVRPLKHEADARISRRHRNCSCDFPRKQTKFLKINEKIS